MKIRTAVLATMVTLAPLGIAQAQVSNPLKFTVFGGAALPTGDMKDGVSTGYTVGGALDYRVPLSPLGFRGELIYSSFGAKDTGGADDADLSELGVDANIVFWLPNAGSPVRAYVTGGPNYSRIKVSASAGNVDASVSDNKFGFNVGAGLDFALGSLSTRLDVRYRRISSDDIFDSGESGTIQYIPITFGITF